MMPDKDYTIERLNGDNIADLYPLFKAVYNKKQRAGYFHRKFDTDYTGVGNIGYIAYSRDRLAIAFYGVVPCFLQQGGELLLAAQSTDTMTHPGYRFKGMFVALSEQCFQLCREHNILLLFGFPNQNSYHGALKLGWIMTGSMDYFSIKTGGLPLERFSSKFWLTKKLYRLYIKTILGKYLIKEDGLKNRLSREGYIGVARSREYLRYRTYNQTFVLEAGGSKAWLKIQNGLVIGDIQADRKADFDALIDTLMRLAKRLGLGTITFHCSKDIQLHELFSSRFTATPSFPTLFQNFGLTIPLENIKFTFADIDIF